VIRRNGHLIAAALCALAALFLVLLGAQLVRWHRQVARDDALFQATPGRSGLWRVSRDPPLDPARAILGLDDDLAYRHALQLYWRAKPRPEGYQPLLANYIATAQTALGRIADTDPDPRRRAIALNLSGVLLLSGTPPQEPQGRVSFLDAGVSAFAGATRLDADNADVKFNLEFAIRAVREAQLDLPGLIHGGSNIGAGQGTAGGAGFVGSGY
jgi:hypothetical protein